MLTRDERVQVRNFQGDLGKIVDAYLREGMDPDIIVEILKDEAASDLFARRQELEAE